MLSSFEEEREREAALLCSCNGEIGPIGAKAFVHGYTCAIGLIVEDK